MSNPYRDADVVISKRGFILKGKDVLERIASTGKTERLNIIDDVPAELEESVASQIHMDTK